MILRGSFVRVTIALLSLSGVLSQFHSAYAAPPTPGGDNAKTITIALPGPFNGCSFFDSRSNATSSAVLDLIRPSAFLTNGSGSLVGEGGPIVTAELTSLQPETVVYTLAPHLTWSNGLAFNGRDLQSWWQRARPLNSVQSDGYRAIKTLRVSVNSLNVTAVFATNYADWNLLFRDVEARTTIPGCALENLLRRPSLGAYKVASATQARIVLVMNQRWSANPNRFGRIVLTTNDALPSDPETYFAKYSLAVDRSQTQSLSAHPSVLSHIGASSSVEEMTFAPNRTLTRLLTIRQALSLALDRQSFINQLWGAVTFSPSVAASAIFSQGQSAYPGSGGSGPTDQTTTTTIPLGRNSLSIGLGDCRVCAFRVLTSAHYHRTSHGWANANGGLLTVRLVAGPSGVDRATAQYAEQQWASAGIAATIEIAKSDAAAAALVAANGVDIAIFARPTSTAVSFTARSWSGFPFADSYPSGSRSATVAHLYSEAIANFNPVAANATWLALDQILMSSFRVRPLFTAPSLIEWSSSIAGVSGSLSIPGFLDQEVNWSAVASTSS